MMSPKLARPCAGHATHDRTSEVVATRCMPSHDTAQISQYVIGHGRAASVGDVVKQPDDVRTANIPDLADAKLWEDVTFKRRATPAGT